MEAIDWKSAALVFYYWEGCFVGVMVSSACYLSLEVWRVRK